MSLYTHILKLWSECPSNVSALISKVNLSGMIFGHASLPSECRLLMSLRVNLLGEAVNISAVTAGSGSVCQCVSAVRLQKPFCVTTQERSTLKSVSAVMIKQTEEDSDEEKWQNNYNFTGRIRGEECENLVRDISKYLEQTPRNLQVRCNSDYF